MLVIDGSFGEGGGQIIRTALTLSMITQTPIKIINIRANRKKSGLMRQHLVCVQASQQISHATVTGAELGSSTLTFAPQTICAGNYHIDIGSAGSTSLVLQTLLPALMTLEQPSVVTICGGTHNPLAPTADFLHHAFFPAIAQMGVCVDFQLQQAGFAPVGGGKIVAKIQPFNPSHQQIKFQRTDKGHLTAIELTACELNLNVDILNRELHSCEKRLLQHTNISKNLISTKYCTFKGIGEGNSCFAVIKYHNTQQNYQEVFSLLGEKRTSAENIGHRLAGLIQRFINSPACVDEYLTDQLLLPLALTGGGVFTSRYISEHTRTQAHMIEQFLPINIDFFEKDNQTILITVNKRQ